MSDVPFWEDAVQSLYDFLLREFGDRVLSDQSFAPQFGQSIILLRVAGGITAEELGELVRQYCALGSWIVIDEGPGSLNAFLAGAVRSFAWTVRSTDTQSTTFQVTDSRF